MKKEYLIAFIVVVVVFGLFIYFRSQNKTAENLQIGKEAYVKLTDISKKVPRAGMTQMAAAINKYKAKNGQYPKKLEDLYPDFIPNDVFIREIDWRYENRGDDFYLTKTIVSGNRRMVASTDKSLILTSESERAVAARAESKKAPEAELPDIAELKPPSFVFSTRLEPEKEEEIQHLIAQPVLVALDYNEIGSGVSADIARKYFVWKTGNGALGFGNVIYPDNRELRIYKNNRWYQLEKPLWDQPAERRPVPVEAYDPVLSAFKRRALVWKDARGVLGFGNVMYPLTTSVSVFKGREWLPLPKEPIPPGASLRTSTAESTKLSDKALAAEYAKRYLVWKNSDGTMGYGNVAYPKKRDINIYAADNWVRLAGDDGQRVLPASAAGSRVVDVQTTEATLAQTYSRQYLVWKDKTGALGYGNVLYPEKRSAAVYQQDEWVPVEKEPVDQSAAPSVAAGGTTASTGMDIPEYAKRYLVWKDQTGAIGFGNVNYPEARRVAVPEGAEWAPMETRQDVPAGPQTVSAAGTTASEPSPASKYSRQYLVWKDGKGRIGFGNVQYPRGKRVNAYVDGDWRNIMN